MAPPRFTVRSGAVLNLCSEHDLAWCVPLRSRRLRSAHLLRTLLDYSTQARDVSRRLGFEVSEICCTRRGAI